LREFLENWELAQRGISVVDVSGYFLFKRFEVEN